MDIIEFIELNLILLGALGLGVFFYLVFLIKKRKKKDFLHDPK